MTTRAFANVYGEDGKVTKRVNIPAVFRAPIRDDIVSFVHSNLSKNSRQAHGVDPKAGMKHSAESWGTGRAVARIPRVGGSGTHRSGQGAFGNQCRKGRMSHPLKTWRRWHRRVNLKQRRHAVESALAATGITSLVFARGHRVQNVPELPLVVEDKIENYTKTKQAIKFLKTLGAFDDVQKVLDNYTVRAGQGKARNNRYKLRKGPLIVYKSEHCQLVHAFRNLPGVEVQNVARLNLRSLAPGGQLGRFIIWTASAFEEVNRIYNEFNGRVLQKECVSNPDISRIINSNQVQSTLKPLSENKPSHYNQKKNPLVNSKAMDVLNPYAKLQRQTAAKQIEQATKARKELIGKKRAEKTKEQKALDSKLRKGSRKWFQNVIKNLNDAATADKQRERELLQALQSITK